MTIVPLSAIPVAIPKQTGHSTSNHAYSPVTKTDHGDRIPPTVGPAPHSFKNMGRNEKRKYNVYEHNGDDSKMVKQGTLGHDGDLYEDSEDFDEPGDGNTPIHKRPYESVETIPMHDLSSEELLRLNQESSGSRRPRKTLVLRPRAKTEGDHFRHSD
eukprot:UN24749